jgi:hypothetical protein
MPYLKGVLKNSQKARKLHRQTANNCKININY